MAIGYRRLVTGRRSPYAPSTQKTVGRKIAGLVSSLPPVNPRHDKNGTGNFTRSASRQLNSQSRKTYWARSPDRGRALFFGRSSSQRGLVLTFTLDHVW